MADGAGGHACGGVWCVAGRVPTQAGSGASQLIAPSQHLLQYLGQLSLKVR